MINHHIWRMSNHHIYGMLSLDHVMLFLITWWRHFCLLLLYPVKVLVSFTKILIYRFWKYACPWKRIQIDTLIQTGYKGIHIHPKWIQMDTSMYRFKSTNWAETPLHLLLHVVPNFACASCRGSYGSASCCKSLNHSNRLESENQTVSNRSACHSISIHYDQVRMLEGDLPKMHELDFQMAC